jgi:hypothetical protein
MKNNISSNGVSEADLLEKDLAKARLFKSFPRMNLFP